jgi:hypothetical protein
MYTPPKVVGTFVTDNKEMMFFLYLPVSLPQTTLMQIPLHLSAYRNLINMAIHDYGDISNKYVYITVKRLYVEKGNTGARAGWHTDGFGTTDINYVWTDSQPTEFCNQQFELSTDHEESMAQMSEQVKEYNISTYDPNKVLRIDHTNVHRCPVNMDSGYRTFARVSISDHKYDMEGNSHNHLLNYAWYMHPRAESRNVTTK